MDIIIVGTGATGKIAYEYFSYDSQYTVVAFAINSNYFREDLTEFYGLPVIALEKIEDKYPPNKVRAFVAIGNSALNRDRARVYHYMEEKGYSLVSYVSS
ncbi:MAG: hypothetical protein LBF57_02175, partial [Holosporaceae bacterium]|nr:hypothetical protein [Holosporaceae bacterium]